jgi:hypothetical protein
MKNYENINLENNLYSLLQDVKLDSIQSPSQIQEERKKELSEKQKESVLDKHNFLTSLVAIYNMRDGKPHVSFIKKEHNPFFSNKKSFEMLLLANYGIILNAAHNNQLLENTCLAVPLKDLDLSLANKTCAHFTIYPQTPNYLNPSQRVVAELVHGEGPKYDESMHMLEKAGIHETRIQFIKPNEIPNESGISIVTRTFGLLGSFENQSFVSFAHRNIYPLTDSLSDSIFVRAHLRRNKYDRAQAEITEVNEIPLENEYKTALDFILANKKEAVKVMKSERPKYFNGIKDIMNLYLGSK